MAKRKPKAKSYPCIGGPIDGDEIPAEDLKQNTQFGALTSIGIVHVYDLKDGKLVYNRKYYYMVDDGEDKQPGKGRKR